MAFPIVPTTAAGRILGNNQADTVATRTSSNLSGLTKDSGDLLIFICVAYQTSTGTNAAFSGWPAGWTEFCDRATSTTCAIGAAYKWSTGTETGTLSVTQAGTITGHAAMIVMSIPGAHATTPPEAGTAATGTGAAAPPALDPAGWAAEDTLWIAVNVNGMTNATGTWTANNGAPTNYTDFFGTNPPDSSIVGQVGGAVAFRQLNATSESPGAFSQDTSNARNTAVLFAVRPAPVATPTQTSVAQLSLSAASAPATQTAHSIHVRARRNTVASATIRAALYEGATNRSGDLESSALTASFAEYTLSIPDASAANITSYADLELRLWSYSAGGATGTVEVAEAWLEIPAAVSENPPPIPVMAPYVAYTSPL